MPFIAWVKGTEVDWLGQDADGHVALFSSAGGGLIPRIVACDVEAQDDAIARISALPACTAARFAPRGNSTENTWKLVAERGLFAYDADFNGGPYNILAAPEVPTTIDALPTEMSTVVEQCKLRGVSFATTTELHQRHVDDVAERPVDLRRVEARLTRVLRGARELLPDRELDQMVDLVEHGEPGVALEHFCAQLFEHSALLSRAQLLSTHSLAAAMGMELPGWFARQQWERSAGEWP